MGQKMALFDWAKKEDKKHPKCKGYAIQVIFDEVEEYGCKYHDEHLKTLKEEGNTWGIDYDNFPDVCDQCIYSIGDKDPETPNWRMTKEKAEELGLV